MVGVERCATVVVVMVVGVRFDVDDEAEGGGGVDGGVMTAGQA